MGFIWHDLPDPYFNWAQFLYKNFTWNKMKLIPGKWMFKNTWYKIFFGVAQHQLRQPDRVSPDHAGSDSMYTNVYINFLTRRKKKSEKKNVERKRSTSYFYGFLVFFKLFLPLIISHL